MIKMHFRLFFFFLIFPLITRCQEQEGKTSNTKADASLNSFGPAQDLGELTNKNLDEASGIVVSKYYDNALWVHNDSGNDPLLFLINNEGKTLKTFYLQGIDNRDWEDITLGPGPEDGQTYLYIGETGDNNQKHDTKYIYRFPEPETTLDDGVKVDTIREVDVITFQYPGKTQNAEALMIDPVTKDLYIIAKNLEEPFIYQLTSEQMDLDEKLTLEKTQRLNIKSEGPPDLVTAADISADGLEVLVKTYGHIYYWKRDNTQTSIPDLLHTSPVDIPYNPEPQGEAIGFTPQQDGFYTLSENRFGIVPHLFFYSRK